MSLLSGSEIQSNFINFPLFRTNVAHTSMPNSMPISSLKICTVWTSDSKPFSFLACNFKSSKEKRRFAFSMLLDIHVLTYAKLQSMEQGRVQVTKVRVNHHRIFVILYPLHLEIDYSMSNPPSMLSYFQTRNAWFVHSPQLYQGTLQSKSVELYHMFSYNQFMRLLGFFSHSHLSNYHFVNKNRSASPYTFVYTRWVPLAITFSFLNNHRFHLLIYLSITSILRVSM